MDHVIIAPVSKDMTALFSGLKNFTTRQIVLVTLPSQAKNAELAAKKLEELKIPVTINQVKGDLWEGMFQAVKEVKTWAGDKNVIINVGTGDGAGKCIAISAAFVNGLKAVDIDSEGKAHMLPILKFNYYKLLSQKKMELLKILFDKDCCKSLEELSKKTKMSLPLISYHINGNLKSEGLKDHGLVETHQHGGKTSLAITTLGRLLVQGSLDQPKE